MTALRVLGIDPGLTTTGYACIELATIGAEPRIVEAGAIRLTVSLPLAARLRQLHEELETILDELAPTHLVVESLFTHQNHLRTGMLMAHARGVVLLAGARRMLSFDEIPPATVKKALTGGGQATKRQVQLAVMAQCGLAAPPEPADVADAIAIAVTGARRLLTRSF